MSPISSQPFVSLKLSVNSECVSRVVFELFIWLICFRPLGIRTVTIGTIHCVWLQKLMSVTDDSDTTIICMENTFILRYNIDLHINR